MSQVDGFIVVESPREEAERWFELYRAGQREEAEASLVAQQDRIRREAYAAVDAELEELAQAIS
jgi:hypothetical protein